MICLLIRLFNQISEEKSIKQKFITNIYVLLTTTTTTKLYL